MNKKVIISLIVFFALLAGIIASFFSLINVKYTPKNLQIVKEIVKKAGFTITSEDKEGFYESIKDTNAVSFAVYDNDIDALKIFMKNQRKFIPEDAKNKTSANLANYHYASAQVQDHYVAMAAVGNTYLVGTSEYYLDRSVIDDIFSSVGYNVPSNLTSVILSTLFFSLAFAAQFVIAICFIFKKAGIEPLLALIPFYNVYLFNKIAGLKPLLFILLFIPYANFIYICFLDYKATRAFGKSPFFSVLTVLCPFLFFNILAYDDSKYIIEK